jgi:6-phosphogluconolactonase/glucosamine-6-phosphate isomerase/deaminase
MEIIRSSYPAKEAGKKLASILAGNLKRPVLLMLSGGSAFEILDNIDTDVFVPNLTLSLLDERFSEETKVNNFSQLTLTLFFKSCVDKGAKFISTKVLEGESMEQLRERWNKSLQDWKKSYPDGLVIVTMGIGNDGHTAGIFSGDYGVDFNGGDWVVAYSVPKEVNEFTNRITVTNTFLKNEVDEAIVYAVGDRKREIIESLTSNSVSITKVIPASVMKDMRTVSFFTDKD